VSAGQVVAIGRLQRREPLQDRHGLADSRGGFSGPARLRVDPADLAETERQSRLELGYAGVGVGEFPVDRDRSLPVLRSAFRSASRPSLFCRGTEPVGIGIP
jgi:hypothetical protein